MNKKTKEIKRRAHTGVHIVGEKNLLIFSQKYEKAEAKNTLVDRWKMSHETIGITEIKTRVC